MLLLVLIVLDVSAGNAFVVSSTQCRGANSMIRSSSPIVMHSALDGIKEPIENYVHIW
jgi:hypothetical protein